METTCWGDQVFFSETLCPPFLGPIWGPIFFGSFHLKNAHPGVEKLRICFYGLFSFFLCWQKLRCGVRNGGDKSDLEESTVRFWGWEIVLLRWECTFQIF